MKAVRLIKPGQPLEMQEIPIPEVGTNDVLVQVKAAGVCHSDAHYRAGVSPVRPLPMTLGHEVAGVVEKVGQAVKNFSPGDRVCLHYLVTCGNCEYCNQGSEQFCTSASMIGKYRHGGYAEYIGIPARSVFRLPDEIPFDQGAIMMCSASTSYHALKKARLEAGETVAVFGVGGLGMSAVQLAYAMGARKVYAVDIKPDKLALAEHYGAIPVNAGEVDPVDEIKRLTDSRGVAVTLELIGLPVTMRQAIDVLAVFGRVGLVGLNERKIEIDPYVELLSREAEIIGVSDHLASELPTLIEFARMGKLDLSKVISHTIPLDADVINETFDELDAYSHAGRVVITP
ncbi:MAG: zinc-binding dehydrogenase [Anaerolineales bacterium]|nr:zinc-binding dehydrogenase [Anaerolineales bacterium]